MAEHRSLLPERRPRRGSGWPPGDERHGEPEAAAGFAGVEHGEDVGMLEPRGGADLADEALLGAQQEAVGADHLEGDGAAVAHILGGLHEQREDGRIRCWRYIPDRDFEETA